MLVDHRHSGGVGSHNPRLANLHPWVIWWNRLSTAFAAANTHQPVHTVDGLHFAGIVLRGGQVFVFAVPSTKLSEEHSARPGVVGRRISPGSSYSRRSSSARWPASHFGLGRVVPAGGYGVTEPVRINPNIAGRWGLPSCHNVCVSGPGVFLTADRLTRAGIDKPDRRLTGAGAHPGGWGLSAVSLCSRV